MARNLVQIADDVKDMSVAQIRRHIQEGSHIPIWILTGELDTKLKNLATAGAQQAAAQNASQPSTVVDGLMDAVGNIPEAAPDTTVDMTAPNPLSNAGATAAAAPPQPNPAIQALMAAQNPTARMGMPTVRAVRGYNAPVMYPGKSMGSTTTSRDTPRLTPEMWAMITAARQKRGDPRLYGEGKARFEEAYVKGARPTSEPAFGGILSQLAAVERDRAYGGSDTLPYSMTAAHGGPVRNLPTVRMQGVEIPPNSRAALAQAMEGHMDIKNRGRSEANRKRLREIALRDELARRKAALEVPMDSRLRQSVDPGIFVKPDSTNVPPLTGRGMMVKPDSTNALPLTGRGMMQQPSPNWKVPVVPRAGGGTVLPTVRMQGIKNELPAITNELPAITNNEKTLQDVLNEIEGGVIGEPAFKEYETEGPSLEAIIAGAGEGAVLHTAETQLAAQQEARRKAEALARSRLWEDESLYMGGVGAGGIDPEIFPPPVKSPWEDESLWGAGGIDPEVTGLGVDVSPQEAQLAIAEAQAYSQRREAPTNLVTRTLGGDAFEGWKKALDLDLLGDVEGQEKVPTLASKMKELKVELGDDAYSTQEKALYTQAEKDLKTFEESQVVPQSVKDIRGHIAKSIEALERNPLPWMRAAAAAINGRQPMLVAMTNAMIGYTEGKEELRKEGLETMGKLVDLDMQMAGLEAQKAATVYEQQQLITQARLAGVKGDRDREAQLVTAASASIDKIKQFNLDRDRIHVTMSTAFMQFMATDAARSDQLMNDMYVEHGKNPEYFTISPDGTATPTIKAWTELIEAINPKAPSFAGQTAFFAAQKYQKDVLNTINDVKTDAMKLADEKFAGELLAKDSPFKRWMAANGLSLPKDATVNDPTSMGVYQMWAITQDERYIKDPEIRAAIHQTFPDLRRIQSGGAGSTRRYNPSTGDFEN